MPPDIWPLMLTSNPSLRNRNLRGRIKVTHVGLFRGGVRLMRRYAVTGTYGNWIRGIQKGFSVFQNKRARLRNNFITTSFGKSFFITQHRMRYTFYIPLNAKDLTIELTMATYGNRQNARANNSNLLWALTHLIETRLNTNTIGWWTAWRGQTFRLIRQKN